MNAGLTPIPAQTSKFLSTKTHSETLLYTKKDRLMHQ